MNLRLIGVVGATLALAGLSPAQANDLAGTWRLERAVIAPWRLDDLKYDHGATFSEMLAAKP